MCLEVGKRNRIFCSYQAHQREIYLERAMIEYYNRCLIDQNRIGEVQLIKGTIHDFIMPTQKDRVLYIPEIPDSIIPDNNADPSEAITFYMETGSIPNGWVKDNSGPRSKIRISQIHAEPEIDCDPQVAIEYYNNTGSVPWGWKKPRCGPRSKTVPLRINIAANIGDGKFFLTKIRILEIILKFF